MLIYVDAPKFFKVFRQEQTVDGVKRTRLGRLMKQTTEFRADEGLAMSDQEKADLETAADALKGADRIEAQADALRFPALARRVAEYYADGANEFEKRLIAAAAQEMARAIRKAGRDDSPSGQAT
jgi:hypothetical protein